MAIEHSDGEPLTRADWVDRRLKGAILDGSLRPGEKLTAASLAEAWNVSPTPLREAFQRLAAQGLVEIRPQRGARVAAVSLEEAEEIYELRILLEPRALRRSLESSDDAHRLVVAGAFSRLAAGAADLASAVEAHAAFHRALLARCPAGWLRRFTDLLADHSTRYQVLAAAPSEGSRDPLAEHRRLAEAVAAGDVVGAVSALVEHLEASRAALSRLGPE